MSRGLIYNIQRMSVDDGPGLRTTIFLKGCPLKCLWCSNPESQSFEPELLVFENLCSGCGHCAEICSQGAVLQNGAIFNRDKVKCQNCGICVQACPGRARVMSGRLMSPDEVMKEIRKDAPFYQNSEGGVTFGGGEPTAGGEFLLELLERCQAEGFHTCVDTCGYCPEDFFRSVASLTDLFLFDCKHMSAEKHRELTGRDNSLILNNLRWLLSSGKPFRLRMPLMPNLNDSSENIAAMALFLRDFPLRDIEVMPCHAFGLNKYAALNIEYPQLKTYTPGELSDVFGRFEKFGLTPSIV